ncbi:MAG: acyl carrier protein [bacterium]|nr:acyl carrier protein [bacterium]
MNIKETIKVFLEKETQKKVEDDNTDLIKNGLLDSFNMIRLISFIETELGIRVNMEEIGSDNFNSVENIASTIQKWK